MKIQVTLLITLYIILGDVSPIGAALSNRYIYIREHSIEVGSYIDGSLKSKKYRSYPLDQINKEEIRSYLLGDQKENVLYYIHCWLGNISFYNKSSIRSLQHLNGFDKMISIKWEGDGLSYRKNWYRAKSEGEKVGELLEYLLQSPDKTNVLLCHSMGHVVFTGIFENLKKEHQYFDKVFFASADLPEHILENELKDLPLMTLELRIYVHSKDRFLQFASFVHHEHRLGMIYTIDNVEYKHIENLSLIDVTPMKGRNKLNLSNHTYFKDHAGVRKDMNECLTSLL